MWWSFCCRYVTVGLEVFRRFSARLDRVRMWNWGRFIFTENSNSSQMLSCPDENRLQFFGWEQGPCYRGTKFFFGLLASAQCQRHWSVKIPFGFLPPKTALRIIYYIVQAIELCSKTGLLRKAKREARKNKTEKRKGFQFLRLRNQAYFVSCCSEISDLEMQSFGPLFGVAIIFPQQFAVKIQGRI